MVEYVRSDVKTSPSGYVADIRRDIFAIAIGPDSDVDEVYIIPEGELANHPAAPSDGSVVRQQPCIHPAAIHVSVERPYVGGPIKGPFRILYPYAPMLEGSAAPLRLRPYDDALWTGSALGAQFRRRFSFELEFYDCPPAFLPTKRAPLKHLFNYPGFGTSSLAGGDVDQLIPVMGRKDLQLGIEGTAITSGGGSLTWSLTGLVVIEDTGSSLILSIAEALISDTVESADFEKSYDIDGEFDVLWLRVDETTALGAAARVSGYVKGWD